MRFSTDVYPHDLPHVFGTLRAIGGVEMWARKAKILANQLRENPFLEHWQFRRHALEIKMARVVAQWSATGSLPAEITDPAYYSLIVFAAGTTRLYERLSAIGRNRLRGMIVSGLQPDNSLLSVEHEVTTATHLITRGFDVECVDLENHQGGVDFIARLGDREAEIECKMFTGDLGRKIHNRKAIALAHYVNMAVDRVYQAAQRGIFISVSIPDRLSCSPPQLRGIESAIQRGALSGELETEHDYCRVRVYDFPIAGSPFEISSLESFSRSELENFVRSRWGRFNQQMVIKFSPGKRAVILLVESSQPDAVLDGIYRQLREACRSQFSASRPGYLLVQFQDLSEDQIAGLAHSHSTYSPNATGLQMMTNRLLDSNSRSHIHGVAYRSQGKLVRHTGQVQTVTESGHCYIVKNHQADSMLDDLFNTAPMTRILFS